MRHSASFVWCGWTFCVHKEMGEVKKGLKNQWLFFNNNNICCLSIRTAPTNHILVQMQIYDNRVAETSWVAIVLTREGDSSKHIGTVSLFVCRHSNKKHLLSNLKDMIKFRHCWRKVPFRADNLDLPQPKRCQFLVLVLRVSCLLSFQVAEDNSIHSLCFTWAGEVRPGSMSLHRHVISHTCLHGAQWLFHACYSCSLQALFPSRLAVGSLLHFRQKQDGPQSFIPDTNHCFDDLTIIILTNKALKQWWHF